MSKHVLRIYFILNIYIYQHARQTECIHMKDTETSLRRIQPLGTIHPTF